MMHRGNHFVQSLNCDCRASLTLVSCVNNSYIFLCGLTILLIVQNLCRLQPVICCLFSTNELFTTVLKRVNITSTINEQSIDTHFSKIILNALS